MPTYTYAPAPVLVEVTGEFAIGAEGVFRATDGGDPVDVWDLNDSPISNVVVGPKGAHQAFKADIPNGILDFGSVLLPTASLEQQEAALAALAIAEQADAASAAATTASAAATTAAATATTAATAAATAAAAAEASALAADGVTLGEIQNTSTTVGAAIRVQLVPFWKAAEVVTAGMIRVDVDGNTIQRNANGTTRSTYDATEKAAWTVVGGLVLGTTAGTALDAGDIRLLPDQIATQASVRTLGTGVTQAAAGTHTHTATQVSDSTTVGRNVLTAADAAAARTATGAAQQSLVEGIVYWNGSSWGASRPTGWKRIRWAANGSTSTTDPSLTLGAVGDIWEKPA